LTIGDLYSAKRSAMMLEAQAEGNPKHIRHVNLYCDYADTMKKFDCRFEASLNTLYISADFAKKASNTNSAEYRHLCELLRNNSGMKIEKRTRLASNRLTYKEMEARLRRIDKNGKLIEAFKLVIEIAKTEDATYAYVYNWYKSQMNAIKAEKENEKKASASSKEDMLKQLAELTAGISCDASAAEGEMELEEEFEEEAV